MICPPPLVRAESSDRAVELDISCSCAGLLPQSLHVLDIVLFLVLSLIIQLSWVPLTSRAVLPGTFPSRPWKKPQSPLLEPRVAVILLFILLPSGTWIPLIHGSCSQGCHWLSHYHCYQEALCHTQESSSLLVFHLAALPGRVRVVKIPNEDQGLWMGDFYLLAADACHITLLFSYLGDLIVFKPLLHTEHDFFPSVLPEVCVSLHCCVLVRHIIPPCLCNPRETIALSSCMWVLQLWMPCILVL